MRIIRGINELKGFNHACVATIGNFDGVHLGHKLILDQLKQKSSQLDLPTVVIVFEPQPEEYFRPDSAPARLTRLPEKIDVLQHYGIDYVLCLRFTAEFARLSAEDFIRAILLDGLAIKYLIVGDDFRFGHQRSGEFTTLVEAGAKYGFGVENSQTFCLEGERVSSSRLRLAVEAGDFALAERLMGRPYGMVGRIIHGHKRGRTIGFPTANLPVRRKKCPLRGVYVVRMEVSPGQWVNGVANLGNRPTVDGTRILLEVNLFDFDEVLYGRRVQVIFLKKLRDEQKFVDFAALKKQIQYDVEVAKDYFARLAVR